MKKLWIIAAVTVILYSCGESRPKTQNGTEQNEIDIHNARISLDYEGVYNATMPTASGVGMVVYITLGNTNYVKITKYLSNNHSFIERGEYSWNEAGNIITLKGITNAPNKYFVGENILIQLDMDGNMITGELADMYILHKAPVD
jgi:uncharacterized lipoprotein NlpE involved in copper resistance